MTTVRLDDTALGFYKVAKPMNRKDVDDVVVFPGIQTGPAQCLSIIPC
ncbi:hypothetical protein [Polaromonas sp.]|nr:hypothetical protein [Burkholderiales bacterium]